MSKPNAELRPLHIDRHVVTLSVRGWGLLLVTLDGESLGRAVLTTSATFFRRRHVSIAVPPSRFLFVRVMNPFGHVKVGVNALPRGPIPPRATTGTVGAVVPKPRTLLPSPRTAGLTVRLEAQRPKLCVNLKARTQRSLVRQDSTDS